MQIRENPFLCSLVVGVGGLLFVLVKGLSSNSGPTRPKRKHDFFASLKAFRTIYQCSIPFHNDTFYDKYQEGTSGLSIKRPPSVQLKNM